MANEQTRTLRVKHPENTANNYICHDNTNMKMIDIQLSLLTASVSQIQGLDLVESEGIYNSEYVIS